MPELVDGVWVKSAVAASEIKQGAFHREQTRFRDWIGPLPQGQAGESLPPVAGRYHLYVSYLCPWASRTLIFRQLKGLQDLIGLSVSEPELGEEGWVFPEGEANYGYTHLYQLYTAADPHYSGKVSVPVLWDKQTRRIVNNESAEIIRIFNTAFDELTGNRLDFYPAHLRDTIEAWNDRIYRKVNNGVYKAGFATSQAAYEKAFDGLFETLDALEQHLAGSRYLAGQYLSEADWRLFVTLIRFDAAYHGQFKCNLKRIEDHPNLAAYMRELYQWPGVSDTVRIDHIKRGYYGLSHLNPTGIIPKGPALDFDRPHERGRLPSRGVWLRTD